MHLVWFSWYFSYLWFTELTGFLVQFFWQIYKNFGHYFLKYIFVPFSISFPTEAPIIYVLDQLILFYKLLGLCAFLKNHFYSLLKFG